MCIRINNLNQLKLILKHFYQSFNRVIQKQFNQLVKIQNRKTLATYQQFKLELHKFKVLFKTKENKIETISNGLLKLLIFRVYNLFFFNSFKILI